MTNNLCVLEQQRLVPHAWVMSVLTAVAADAASCRVAAEPDDERFDILDENGNPLGVTERRAVVHAKGLFHRAVYCFVLDASGALLLQRRSAGKRVGPNQWDLSVAEHLQPGESYHEAVLRGLEEELGVRASSEAVQGPLCPVHLRRLALPAQAIFDNEYVESYKLVGFRGKLDVNAEEVSEVRFVAVQQILQEMAAAPQDFTEWFREELQLVMPQLLS